MSKKQNINAVIIAFVIGIVGLAISPAVQSHVTTILATGTTGDLNMTGPGRAIISLFPVFWVILMISIPLASIGYWLVPF